MAKASDVIKIALAEVGYKEKASNSQLDNPTANAGSNNYTKYARDLRDAGYYNGNKNGFAWCDVFVDWCFFKAFGKTEGQRIECQTGDLGAGCKYSKQYYQNKGRCDRKPKVGDQIFFTSGGSISHTGIVTAVSGENVTTVEGNSGDAVKQHTYSLSNSYVDSFGHPLYDEEEQKVDPEQKTEVRGIDVSKWQGEIDWTKVKADGVKFAMIRLGYGSADGNSCGLDSYFGKNVQNALKAGIDIGCYFYSYALSVAAAKKEAEYVTGVLQNYKGVFTYPVVFDLEDKTQQSLGKTMLTDMVIAFGDAIEKAGFYFALYSNLNWLKNYLDDSKLKRFDHWLAQWAAAPTYDGDFGIWQTSSTGSVNGISGNVDTDIAYKDYPKIIREANLNGFTGAEDEPDIPVQLEPEPVFKKGDLVRITGTKYYSGKTIPAWVKAKNWYVRSVSGDRIVIDKSEDGKNAICSPVNASDLQLVNTTPEKTVDELAKEVLEGKWGNGSDRKNRLTEAGYDYSAVQAKVNEMLKKETEEYYTVETGDTLSAIAAKYGTTYQHLTEINDLANMNLIFTGQKIRVK